VGVMRVGVVRDYLFVRSRERTELDSHWLLFCLLSIQRPLLNIAFDTHKKGSTVRGGISTINYYFTMFHSMRTFLFNLSIEKNIALGCSQFTYISQFSYVASVVVLVV